MTALLHTLASSIEWACLLFQAVWALLAYCCHDATSAHIDEAAHLAALLKRYSRDVATSELMCLPWHIWHDIIDYCDAATLEALLSTHPFFSLYERKMAATFRRTAISRGTPCFERELYTAHLGYRKQGSSSWEPRLAEHGAAIDYRALYKAKSSYDSSEEWRIDSRKPLSKELNYISLTFSRHIYQRHVSLLVISQSTVWHELIFESRTTVSSPME